MTDFQKTLNNYVSLVENALPAFLPDADCPQASLAKAMAYSLTGGGKRIRAVLLLASAGLFGVSAVKALPFAAAIEMIHAYSLIHDDLPCMDDDDTRRGKPSCHIAFGEDIALLAGDALLTLAFEVCTSESTVQAVGAQKAVSAVHTLAVSAGWAGMVGGQVIDLESEGRQTGIETLRVMDEKKTGALISAAARTGCIVGGADETAAKLLSDFALMLGVAFQIVDDILDVTSDTASLGKPVGSDRDNEKSTYTSLYGVDGAKKLAHDLSAGAKEALLKTGLNVDFLLNLTDMLLERKY